MEGDYLNYKSDHNAKRRMLIDTMQTDDREPEVITREDIPKICTPEIKHVISNYWISKRYGLPYGDKWAKNPANIMDIMLCLDYEDALIKSRS